MFDFQQWILDHPEALVFVLIGFLVMTVLFFVIQTVRFNRLYKRYRQLMRGVDKSNLEEVMIKQAAELQNLRNQVQAVQEAQSKVRQDIANSIGPIGIVRYNAFDDVGSDLSFSVALLNRNKNGVVISSLYGREDTRTYAKPVKNGDSAYKLTDEEKEAIQLAIRNFEQ
ncbi:DUF4446 family protein [Effusibacillus pohliae]|uniref:DUF4446 family protein n=1 Tax=Effusibacillus pohliae TaxID=232270 RepID=UPI0003789BFF|nr:DUF4446 family protein [Effusibacillus pohliae]